MADLSEFYVVNDSGYPTLEHLPGDAEVDGCHIAFVEAGTRLSELVEKATEHQCETEPGGEA